MTATEQVYAGLAEVFAEVFPRAPVAPHADMTAYDVPGWDSLGHVTMIVAIEDRFGIEFTPDEYVAFNSVGELVAIIERKLS